MIGTTYTGGIHLNWPTDMINPLPIWAVRAGTGAGASLGKHTSNIAQFLSKVFFIEVGATLAMAVDSEFIKELRPVKIIQFGFSVHKQMSQCAHKPIGIYRATAYINYLSLSTCPTPAEPVIFGSADEAPPKLAHVPIATTY